MCKDSKIDIPNLLEEMERRYHIDQDKKILRRVEDYFFSIITKATEQSKCKDNSSGK